MGNKKASKATQTRTHTPTRANNNRRHTMTQTEQATPMTREQAIKACKQGCYESWDRHGADDFAEAVLEHGFTAYKDRTSQELIQEMEDFNDTLITITD